ncbi:MAG: hypothetical protein ACTSUE_22200 [Promethearchaeota archaeon]
MLLNEGFGYPRARVPRSSPSFPIPRVTLHRRVATTSIQCRLQCRVQCRAGMSGNGCSGQVVISSFNIINSKRTRID